MNIHELKTCPEYFDKVLEGVKTFEFRFNDRGYSEGDVLVLQEYELTTRRYTGRTAKFRVGCVLHEFNDIVNGWIIMSLLPLKDTEIKLQRCAAQNCEDKPNMLPAQDEGKHKQLTLW